MATIQVASSEILAGKMPPPKFRVDWLGARERSIDSYLCWTILEIATVAPVEFVFTFHILREATEVGPVVCHSLIMSPQISAVSVRPTKHDKTKQYDVRYDTNARSICFEIVMPSTDGNFPKGLSPSEFGRS